MSHPEQQKFIRICLEKIIKFSNTCIVTPEIGLLITMILP